MMTMTENAARRIRQFVSETDKDVGGLRIKVVGGGCSGLQYKLDLDAERKGDKVIERDGARIYVDRKSYLYVLGTEVDYGEGLQNAGFQLANPNVKRTCGCGESFVV